MNDPRTSANSSGPATPPARSRRRSCLLGCLGIPASLFGVFVLAFAVSATVREFTCLGLLAVPVDSVRVFAADKLQHFPTERTTAALVVTLNRVDPRRDEALASNALLSLCLITNQSFHGCFERKPSGWTFGFPTDHDWPETLKSVNAWALDHTVSTLAGAPDQGSAPPAPAEVKDVIERIAGADPKAAGEAWTELGARFNDPAAYLAEVRSFLADPRPVSFYLHESVSDQPGQPRFVYFTADCAPIPANGAAAAARTVGVALRLHLWAYEDVSHSGFSGTFDEWWRGYAEAKGLPAD